jgi:hypothetical protein
MGTTAETGTEIRPFHVEFSGEAIDDLRRRIAATRWPTRELVTDRSQGVQLAAARAMAEYWVAGTTARTSTSSTSGRRTSTRCR